MINDATLVDRGMQSVRDQLGNVVAEGEASLGGEDFAFMTEAVPGLQGVQVLSRVALDLLA